MVNQFKKIKKFQPPKNKMFLNKKIKKKNDQKSYFDKLYIRIFLSAFLLFSMLFCENIFKFNISKIINQNFNVLPIVNLFTKVYDFPEEVEVSLENHYDKIIFKNNINTISSDSFNGVITIESGIVVKIVKENNLYEVTIKGENDREYTYNCLANIDTSLYSYVKQGTIIGGTVYQNNGYFFTILITDHDKFYSVND